MIWSCEAEIIFTSPRLDTSIRDLSLEDFEMAGFVVANLEEAGVCYIWATEGREGGGFEGGDALLVEGVDDPFCCEEILKEEVVWVWVLGGGWSDGCLCFVGWGGVCGAAVGATVG